MVNIPGATLTFSPISLGTGKIRSHALLSLLSPIRSLQPEFVDQAIQETMEIPPPSVIPVLLCLSYAVELAQGQPSGRYS